MINNNILAYLLYTLACIDVVIYLFFGEYIKGNWYNFMWMNLILLVLIFILTINYIHRNIYTSLKKISSVILSSTTTKQTTGVKNMVKELMKFSSDKEVEINILKNRDTFRREFIGNLSHEIKTPLFIMQGYVETLLDGSIKDPIILQKYLKRTSEGIDRLLYVINDLDLISKLEIGKIKLNLCNFDIITLCKNVFDLLEIRSKQKDITLKFDMFYNPIWVYADKERIQQVLSNLIMNSIKYGKKQGTTEIGFQVQREQLLITVSDNGEGIKPEYIDRVFERFFRTEHSRSRKDGGSGLGLSIVKHLLDAHDVSINVKSIYGVGSEFYFPLKLGTPQKQ